MFKLCITGDLGFEVWKDIPGYEGLYQASTYGRIKSIITGKIMKPYVQIKGYLRINLLNNKKFLVHRLVALTFLPKPFLENLQINHRDENPANNSVENLEWCTNKYNCNYGSHANNLSKSLKNAAKKSAPVIQIDSQGLTVASYPSIQEVERQTGYYASSICLCCKGKLKQAYGYIWKYA